MAYHHASWGPMPHYVPMMGPGIASLPSSQPQTHTHTHEQGDKQLEKYTLSFMQQPQHAKAANGKDKDRRPVDPPPILRLEVAPGQDPDGVYKQSPYLIVVAYLEFAPGQEHDANKAPPANLMSGTTVSSLHRLKDPADQEGAFFVFGDLTIRREGHYCLRFDLLQMEFGVNSEPDYLVTVTSVTSKPFRVYSQKNFPKQHRSESTFLTRSFSDQGVRLRVRKDSRLNMSRKRTTDKGATDKSDRKRAAAESPDEGRRAFPHHRGSLDTSDSYYEGEMSPNEQNSGKRHRTGSGTMQVASHTSPDNSLETRAWPSYPHQTGTVSPFSSQGHTIGSLNMSNGPPTPAGMGAPQMPPPTMTRLDTHFGSNMFHGHSPVGERQSPITLSPVHHLSHHSPFGHNSNNSNNSVGSQGSSSMGYLFGMSGVGQHHNSSNSIGIGSSSAQPLNLVAASSSHSTQSVMNNTPRLTHSSPSSRQHPQSHHSHTAAGATSPLGLSLYASAPPPQTTSSSGPRHHQQVSYNDAPASYHQPLPHVFDHDALHEHGMSAPLGGNMPPDSLKDPYGGGVFNGVTTKSE
ncbi:hypothetical protein F5Y17DRAFT_80234 [Xylariaceae sp. FL0594]|nr:hypothetical protein F5Y17DRAFT_80234 [Xylariaceae sp. FL0594]